MDEAQAIIDSITAQIGENANVRVLFGDPIEQDGVSVIPVAQVKIAGGGGGGVGDDLEKGSGGGMGIGVHVKASPIGYIEVKNSRAEFVQIVDFNRLIGLGMVIGGLMGLVFARAWVRSRE